MAESRDPDLAMNLHRLGQVSVPGKGMASTLHTVRSFTPLRELELTQGH